MADRAGDHVFEQVRKIEETNESLRELVPPLLALREQVGAYLRNEEAGISQAQRECLLDSLRVKYEDSEPPAPNLGELVEEAETRASSSAA